MCNLQNMFNSNDTDHPALRFSWNFLQEKWRNYS